MTDQIKLDERIKQIVLDSRVDATDGLFVALVGERSDGHDYIEKAIANGAVAVLSQRPTEALQKKYPQVHFYQVKDTRAALQEIGKEERAAFHGSVIGVTGSVGKTTTRAMIAQALSAGHTVFQTPGNANSQVGVPITMFQMNRSGAELAVVELGMSEPGEMTRIAQVACVDVAVITNIGVAHIEQLKSQENILREKLHILDGMRDGGVLYLDGDDPILSGVTLDTIHGFGIALDKRIQLRYYRLGDYDLNLSVPGRHMMENAMAAMHLAEDFTVPYQAAAAALEAFQGVKGRGEIHQINGMTIIDDAYNASPVSMRAGLAVLDASTGERRIAVLADMRELGPESRRYHREIGSYINTLKLDHVLLLGELAAEIGSQVQKAQVSCYDSLEALDGALKALCQPGDVILFKGSNSMGLSTIVKEFITCTQA